MRTRITYQKLVKYDDVPKIFPERKKRCELARKKRPGVSNIRSWYKLREDVFEEEEISTWREIKTNILLLSNDYGPGRYRIWIKSSKAENKIMKSRADIYNFKVEDNQIEMEH